MRKKILLFVNAWHEPCLGSLKMFFINGMAPPAIFFAAYETCLDCRTKWQDFSRLRPKLQERNVSDGKYYGEQ